MTDLEKEMLRQIHELSKEVTALRERVAVVESKMFVTQKGQAAIIDELNTLRAALAEPDGGGNLPPPLQEPTVAENATTQQQLEDAPPSDYRRGYWDGLNIGKREGRIEAEDALAEPVQEPVACHVFNVTVTGSLHEWEPTTFAFALRDGKHALYTSPPQRKPLTEDEISNIWDGHVVPVFGKNGINPIVFARAIERAHGIGGQP